MSIKEDLIKALMAEPNAKLRSSGAELELQCPRCEANHRSNHGHLYIELINDACMRFNCFHCSFSGSLSPSVLHELGITNQSFDEYLATLNKGGVKQYIKNNGDEIPQYIIPTVISDKDKPKIDYICDRTGINFYNKVNIRRYKLIHNLHEFVTANNIRLEEKPSFVNVLSKNYTGFLSYNNNIVNLRLLAKAPSLPRYINLKINKKIQSPFLYIPPVEVDLLTRNPMMVLAEGVYDIICIKKRFFAEDTTNIIFAAVGNKNGYRRAILKLLQLTGFFGAQVIIYSDQDVPMAEYHKMLDTSIKPSSSIKVHYRADKNKKDFGTMKEDIEGIRTFKI